MVKNFFKIPVQKIEKTTADCVVVTLAIPEEQEAVFQFKQGQYLTLKAEIEGEEVRRSYSLCSAPLEKEWKVAIKKVPKGRFSTFANEVLKEGDVIEVLPPNGRFFVETNPGKAKNYVAFAAGSGITPILSIIKTHLQVEPSCRFQLFYCNQSVSSIILKDEIEDLKNRYLDRFELFHILTRQPRSIPLFNGRIDEEKLARFFEHFISQKDMDDYFICGPNEMIFRIRDFLLERGIEQKQIHFELFNTEGIKPAASQEVQGAIPQLSDIHIIEGGKTFRFSIPQGSLSILDAALANNADLPYACKGGVCCTCRAKVVEGEVEMLVNFGLEPEELAANFVLTCQALPLTEKVVVDFDAIPG